MESRTVKLKPETTQKIHQIDNSIVYWSLQLSQAMMRLREVEAQMQREILLEREEMHGEPRRTHDGEEYEADRQAIPRQLGEQQPEVFEHDHVVELRFPVLARPEHERQFCDAQAATARGEDVQEDLEPARGQLGRHLLERGARGGQRAGSGPGVAV